jgi:hypothetical protein
VLKWLNPFRWLVLAFVTVLAVVVVASLVLFVFPEQDRPGRAGAVFVLAGGKERLPKALALIRSHVAPTLVIDDADPDSADREREQRASHRQKIAPKSGKSSRGRCADAAGLQREDPGNCT